MEPSPFKQKNVFNHRITIQWTFTFQTKKCLHTIELPYNGPLPFKQKNVFNNRITIQWTFTFQTKKCLQPSNYHRMNLYISNKKMSSTTELPYNELLLFKKKYVFHHRITIQWTFTFQTKKCLQPSNYHPMNLYISNKKTSSTIELSYNEPLHFKQKNVFNHRITIEWTFTFQTKNVFKHRITIQWTFTFQTKKRLQPSNYHTMNLYLSNENMSSTIELPYNGPLPFKQKNVFNHTITIQWTFTFQTKNVLYHGITVQWTFTFQTKKCFQPSNYHTMNLYISIEKTSSTIDLPYNKPLPFEQKNVFNHRITIQWTFTFQTKKCLQPSNYHEMNLYLSNKKMFSTIELPYNELLPFKEKYVVTHQITIQWTVTFQTKKCLQPSNYHPMNLYISNKNTSSTIELPYNEPLSFNQKNVFTIELP